MCLIAIGNFSLWRKVAFAFQESAAERRMLAMQKLQRSNWIELESPLRTLTCQNYIAAR